MSVYDIITDRIIKTLEEGTAPWIKPWATAGMPKNLVSGKEYRGINLFLLNMSNYSSPYWLTYRQCKERGGQVKAGQKSTPVIFWKLSEHNDEDGTEGKEKAAPLLRYYNVFNIEQCENLKDIPDAGTADRHFSPITECEQIVNDMPQAPEIKYGEQKAYYVPSRDFVNMPKADSFDNAESYYSTLFHELTHSTGHSSRLNRTGSVGVNSFGSKDYGKEELIAEMGASFLSGIAGIENRTIDNSAAYLQSWLKTIREDKKIVITAAAAAQRAVDFITDKKFAEAAE